MSAIGGDADKFQIRVELPRVDPARRTMLVKIDIVRNPCIVDNLDNESFFVIHFMQQFRAKWPRAIRRANLKKESPRVQILRNVHQIDSFPELTFSGLNPFLPLNVATDN